MEQTYSLTRSEIEDLKRKAVSENTPLIRKWSEVDQEREAVLGGATRVESETTRDPKVVRFQDPERDLEADLDRFADRVRDLEDQREEQGLDKVVLGLVVLSAVGLCVVPFLRESLNHWVVLTIVIEVAFLIFLTATTLGISLLKATLL